MRGINSSSASRCGPGTGIDPACSFSRTLVAQPCRMDPAGQSSFAMSSARRPRRASISLLRRLGDEAFRGTRARVAGHGHPVTSGASPVARRCRVRRPQGGRDRGTTQRLAFFGSSRSRRRSCAARWCCRATSTSSGRPCPVTLGPRTGGPPSVGTQDAREWRGRNCPGR